MSAMIVVITAALATGLASAPHCAAMCGPLATFAGASGRGALPYHAARLLAYALVGALAGASGGALAQVLPARFASAALSLALAAALGLAAWRLWRAGDARERPIAIGRGPRRPSVLDRLYAALPKSPLALGLTTAALPCGALYAGVLAAASSGGALAGAASMLAFGLASGIGLVIVSAVAARARRLADRGVETLFLRRVLATALAIGAILLVVRPVASLSEPEPSCHAAALP